MDEGSDLHQAAEAAVTPPRVLRPRRRPPPRERRGWLWLFVSLMFAGVLLAGAALSLAGRAIPLPVWAVAEAEARLNRALDSAVPGEVDLSVGGASVTVDRDGATRMVLTDVRLLQPGGEAVVSLPEAHVSFDLRSAVAGSPRVTSLRLVGPGIGLRRLPDGRLDLAFGAGMALRFDDAGALLDAADALAARPGLSALRLVEAEGMTLSLDDQRAGRSWELGDGRLTLERRPDGLAAEGSVTLLGGARSARATATIRTDAASPAARMTVRVEGVTAAELASQAAPLDWLRLLDATASGEVTTALGADGALSELTARLDIGAGALTPGAGAAPVAFDRIGLSARFDPARERLDLSGLTVEGPTLKLTASGHADLPGVTAGRPREVLAQVTLDALTVDPEGVFASPAVFTGGALDMRLRLDPFVLDVGQLVLIDGANRGVARGRVSAGPEGWALAFDLGIDAIGSDRLLALWPLKLINRTRTWFAANVQDGTLFDVKGAVRLAPGEAPRLSLSYEFVGAGVRFLRTLPPVEGGQGYATLEGQTYTLVLDRGRVIAPQGGAVDVSRSVLAIADILERPARGDLLLRTRGPLEATLALLDAPPFRFLEKAGRPVALGTGEAEAEARIDLPLGPAEPGDVQWTVAGTVADFVSDVLVPGRQLAAPVLRLSGTPEAIEIAGAGTLEGVPFDAVFRQPLGPDAGGRAEIRGTVELSAGTVERLDLGLPEGMVSGTGQGDITVSLARGEVPRLQLTSDLRGVGLTIPELGWSKGRNGAGTLEVEAVLASPARVTRVALDAGGLRTEGAITLRPGGGLDRAVFDRVRLDGWLDAGVTLTGRGADRAPGVEVSGGSVDLRRMAERGGTGRGGGTDMAVVLDRVQVSDSIALTGLRGAFSTLGGFDGRFTATVNGAGEVAGTVAPTEHGAGLRLTSADGGRVLSAAGIFPNARGGALDMTLTPRAEGGYRGRARITDVRVRNVPALAELINAISVVGLLEQLDGSGILFAEADARFNLTSRGVDLREGVAVGASLGVSMSGVYRFASGELDMQGTISPLYIVNSLGQVLTRRGEGLFGFTYRLTGTAANPSVAVNPLSIFTPGMFREIFRRPPPRIEGGG